MAKKLKLGSEIVSLSDEAFANVGRPDAAPSVSPYQSALQGSQPDQAKMTGSSAQLGAQARRLAAPPTDTLREAIRARQPTQVQGPAGARPFDYEKAARVDEALAIVFAQQMTLAQVGQLGFDENKALQAGYTTTQLNTLRPTINKLLANEKLTPEEDRALTELFRADPNFNEADKLDSLKTIAANLIQEPDDAIVAALKAQIKQGNADFTFSAVPKDKLDKVLLDQGLAEKTKDGEVDYSYIEDVLGPNWRNMSYQDWLKEVTKRRESFTDVKQLQLLYADPQLAPAAKAEIRQQLLDLGYSGVLAEMSAAEKLEVEARNGYSITLGGVSYQIDEILDGVVLEGTISAALAAGQGSDEWNKLEPDLKAWMDENIEALRAQYESTTGLLATGLGEGVERVQTAEREEIQRQIFGRQLTAAGFPPELFQNHMTPELLTQFKAYDKVSNGIIPYLKAQTDPTIIQETIASLSAIMNLNNQALKDMIFKQPRWFTEQITLPSGRRVITTTESAGAQILRQIKGMSPNDAALALSEISRTIKENTKAYNGTVEDFAEVIFGVRDATTLMSQLNQKFQSGNFTKTEQLYFNDLDINKDGALDIEDLKQLQNETKAGRNQVANPNAVSLMATGLRPDTILQSVKTIATNAASSLDQIYETAKARKADFDASATASQAFDVRIESTKSRMKALGMELPSTIKDNYITLYKKDGVEAAETFITNYINSLNLAGKESQTQEREDQIEANTKTYNKWIDTYATPEIKKGMASQPGVRPLNNYTPYQQTMDTTFNVLRLRLAKWLPSGFDFKQVEQQFYSSLTSGKNPEQYLNKMVKELQWYLNNPGKWENRNGKWVYKYHIGGDMFATKEWSGW